MLPSSRRKLIEVDQEVMEGFRRSVPHSSVQWTATGVIWTLSASNRTHRHWSKKAVGLVVLFPFGE